MKKVFTVAAMAIAVMGLTTACKQKAAEAVDTMPADTMPLAVVEEEATDTVATDTVAADTVIVETAKKVAKKATQEVKKQTALDQAGRTTNKGGVTLTRADGTKSNAEDNNKSVQLQKANDNNTNNNGGGLAVPTRRR